MDPIAALERSYEQLGKVVAQLNPADLARPTPCTQWDVRAVLNHALGSARMFTLANEGRSVGEDAGDLIGADPSNALAEAMRANVESWRQPGALEGDRSYPFGTFPAPAGLMINVGEVAVHGWDLAKATGQDADIDPDVAKAVYDFYRPIPLDGYRQHGAFGPEVQVPETAPAAARLLGLLGRTP